MTNTTSGKLGGLGRATIIALALAIALAVVLAGSVAQPADAAGSTYYNVTSLDTLWTGSIARDINESGQIAGQGQNPGGQSRAFLWESGQMKDLGVPAGGNLSRARSINGSGQVVGEWRILVNRQQRFKAFLYEDSQIKDLNSLIPTGSGWDLLGAQAINEFGQIVGSGTINSQTPDYLYENGTVTDLGVPLGDPFSEAWGVNDSGDVVGESGDANGGQAFLYANGAVDKFGTLLDHSVHPYSEAMNLNDSGQVVGWSYTPVSPQDPPRGHAFLYESNENGAARIVPLDPLPDDLYSRARDIDDSSRVVGWSRNDTGSTPEQQFSAVLWEDGQVKDLNELIPAGSGWKLTDAYAINESGQIVGSGFKDGQLRAFLLTPDTTKPVIECGAPDGVWHKEDANIPCTASDGGIGLADTADASFALSTAVSEGIETDNAQTNSREVCDAAGNCAMAGPIGGNRIDKRAPDIIIDTPPNGAEYRLNEIVTASYACSDGGSGLGSCSGPVPEGGNVDTASVGSESFAVEAGDAVGNVASKSHAYAVIYDFNGFFSPVDNPPTLNVVNAGRAVPVKFSLSGDQGLDIFADGYPKSQSIECDSTAPVDRVEETVTANASGLTYNPDLDQYNYVWKTERAWGGTCRQLVVKLNDGTFHRPNFEFR